MEGIERITINLEPPARPSRNTPAGISGDEARERPATSPESEPVRAVRGIEAEGRIFQARLSYDYDHEDVVVEILDPRTGDVVRRLPADRAAKENKGFRSSGAFLDRVA